MRVTLTQQSVMYAIFVRHHSSKKYTDHTSWYDTFIIACNNFKNNPMIRY